MRIPFTQVDAFAEAPFTGNPAAVMPLARWPDDALLQQIAAENNLSETAFFVPLGDADPEADFELRWFTPASEVVLCGHATLASGHVVLSSSDEGDRARFRTRSAGILEVTRGPIGDYRLMLPAWAPDAKPLDAIVAALGVDDVVETLWHPQRYGVVVLRDAAAVRAVRPDFRTLAGEGDVLTIVTAPGEGTDVVSRVFAPGAGIDEDPVTGSAHAVIAPYWAKRLGRETFTAYQASARGGRVGVELAGDRVILSGGCVTLIEGTFLLP